MVRLPHGVTSRTGGCGNVLCCAATVCHPLAFAPLLFQMYPSTEPVGSYSWHDLKSLEKS